MRTWMTVLFMAGVLASGVACGEEGGREPARAELEAYVERSEEANALWQRGRDVYNAAVGELEIGDEVAGPRVVRIGERIPEAVELLAEASIIQRSADAPEELAEINERFAQDMVAISDHWDAIGGALRAEDGARFNILASEQPSEVRSEWRIATTAYAREIGVAMPEWTRTIGRVVDDEEPPASETTAPSPDGILDDILEDIPTGPVQTEGDREAIATYQRVTEGLQARHEFGADCGADYYCLTVSIDDLGRYAADKIPVVRAATRGADTPCIRAGGRQMLTILNHYLAASAFMAENDIDGATREMNRGRNAIAAGSEQVSACTATFAP